MAAARTEAAEALRLLQWGAVGAVLWLMLKSGGLRQSEAFLADKVSASWLRTLAAAVLTMAGVEAARLVAAALAVSIRPGGAGLDAATHALLAAAPVEILIGAGGISLLLAAVRRWPRGGWSGLSVLAALVLFALVLVPPVTLDPAARGDIPASGPTASAVLAFLRRGGFETERLSVFDSPDPYAVDVEGLGPLKHAAVSRAALAAPRPETFAALGHLLGHDRRKDLWSLALLWSAIATGFIFAAAKALGRNGSANGPAIVALIAWAALGLATPAFNMFDQAINYRADDYALTLTRDPDALCRWLIATEATDKPDPGPVESLLFYDHPPLAARLANVQRWKSAHGL